VIRPRVILAWAVHAYTALGLACAAGMAVAIFDGSDASFRLAFALMAVATLIDATDGTLARLVRVKEVLPGFDGTCLDNLVDFLTYVALPLLLIWRARLLPEGTDAWLLLPLFAAAYGFSQTQAKTADGYFLGFPSYWNLVAFYLYSLAVLRGWVGLALVVVLALLTFVPARYLYPSMRGRLNFWTNVLAVPWTVLLALSLWLGASDERTGEVLALASLYFPAWYLAVSWAISLHRLSGRSRQPTGRGE
jgi:phosphatidylcholine synthase